MAVGPVAVTVPTKTAAVASTGGQPSVVGLPRTVVLAAGAWVETEPPLSSGGVVSLGSTLVSGPACAAAGAGDRAAPPGASESSPTTTKAKAHTAATTARARPSVRSRRRPMARDGTGRAGAAPGALPARRRRDRRGYLPVKRGSRL